MEYLKTPYTAADLKALLDKLGLGSKQAEPDEAGGGEEEASSEEGVEEAAKSALFDLLKGKDKDKDGGRP